LAQRKAGRSRWITIAWLVVAAESVLCLALGRADISHHRPAQYLGLGSLLVWLPLTPAYYAAFQWHANTRLWRRAFLGWWLALVLTGWIMFLPGVLDHFKFTDGLVGHSFIAMAGFTSSLLIFVMVQLMSVAGWREGFDPTFTIVPSAARDVLYALRLVSGLLMFAASLDWFVDATTLLREPASVSRQIPIAQEETV
jgi:cytochrome c oxidase cbb3-type subunit 1